MQLFHFSEAGDISRFEPRPVRIPSARAPGREWLNGPLVWAIDDWRQPMYLFPRDCPRILVWPTERTTDADRRRWWGERDCRMIAHVEWRWFEALNRTRLYRYELPPGGFISLEDAGMWVCRSAVDPMAMDEFSHLPTALCDCGVELRVMHSLKPLQRLRDTSLHVSAIRLRNASDWPA